jgi:GNAT superfamily N-acetyltransferase
VLDKSLPYYDIFMKRAAGTAIPPAEAPEGISIRTYRDGDEEFWAETETAVGEFSCKEDALARFSRDFLPWKEELPLRCLFAVTPAGKSVGNLSVWWNNPETRDCLWIHWVAVHPEYQGRGIGTYLVNFGLHLAVKLEGDTDICLKTQTWSWQAIRIYLAAGFRVTDEPEIFGFINKDSSSGRLVLKDKVPGIQTAGTETIAE